MKKKITILGATGSIGNSTLAVIRENKDIDVFAISGYSNLVQLELLCEEFSPEYVVVSDEESKLKIEKNLSDVKVLCGNDGLEFVSQAKEVDIVMSAIVGIAGLKPTFAAAKAGKKILLANKESLVTAGHLLMQEAQENGADIIPVDSEHNAIFQCLDGDKKYSKSVKEIVLTASGGPFRDKKLSELESITPEQACAHPNWSMGRKISVDSSTMVNKALEVIEAYWLFDVPSHKINVLIHPQSIIHSMVRYIDGSYIAQLGSPDMKTPIANAIYYPVRGDANVNDLDFVNLNLTFKNANFERFGALRIVFDNLKNKNYAGNIIFNATNEVLVDAFLRNKIKYLDIIKYNEKAVKELKFDNPLVLDDVFYIDAKAREYINNILEAA